MEKLSHNARIPTYYNSVATPGILTASVAKNMMQNVGTFKFCPCSMCWNETIIYQQLPSCFSLAWSISKWKFWIAINTLAFQNSAIIGPGLNPWRPTTFGSGFETICGLGPSN